LHIFPTETRKSVSETHISLFDLCISHSGSCISLADSPIISLIHVFLWLIYVFLSKKYTAQAPFFGASDGECDGDEKRRGSAGLKWAFHPSRLTNLHRRFTGEIDPKQNGENGEGRGGFPEIA